MVKKQVILILSLVIILTSNTYGADIIYRLTHGDQYALVLVTVEDVNENYIKVIVDKTLQGKKVEKVIKIFNDKDNFYWYIPKKGDYLVASIDKEKLNYKLKWGIFKVSSLNYKTLNIVESSLSSKDNAMFNFYINSGCRVNNFYLKEGKVFIKDKNQKRIEIYPKVSKDIHINNSKTLSIEKANEDKEYNFLVSGIVILSFVALLYSNRKKFYDRY
ncbi:MAG: hypothetical protein FH751_03925 [Firmicutes bacterium]|nr:hypothetical protein [Bacillota bacterium]